MQDGHYFVKRDRRSAGDDEMLRWYCLWVYRSWSGRQTGNLDSCSGPTMLCDSLMRTRRKTPPCCVMAKRLTTFDSAKTATRCDMCAQSDGRQGCLVEQQRAQRDAVDVAGDLCPGTAREGSYGYTDRGKRPTERPAGCRATEATCRRVALLGMPHGQAAVSDPQQS